MESTELEKTVANSDAANEKRNKINQIYTELEGIYNKKGTIEVEITSVVKGGFKVQYKELPLYLPFKLFTNNRNISNEEFQKNVGSKIEVAIIDFLAEDNIRTVSISYLKVIEDKLLKELKVDMKVSGTVVAILPNKGLVFNLDNGLSAFAPMARLTKYHLPNIEDLGIKINDKLDATIVDITNKNNKYRIILSIENYIPEPVKNLLDNIKVGDRINKKIKNIIEAGLFVEIIPGIDGFVKKSEISWTKHNINLKEMFKIGQEIETEIIYIDKENLKINLSYRKTLPNTWNEIVDKYSLDNEYNAAVISIAKKGVYLSLNDEIEGFMPISKMKTYLKDNKINLNMFDIVQVRIASKDTDKSILIFEAANQPQPRIEKQQNNINNNNKYINKKTHSNRTNNYSIIELLSEASKKELFKK